MSNSWTGFTVSNITEFIENERKYSGEVIVQLVEKNESEVKEETIEENKPGGSGIIENQTEELVKNPEQAKESNSNDTFLSCDGATADEYLSSDMSSENERKGYDHICRICHELGRKDVFLTPCNCKGTISSVHRECIERWLAEKDTDRCEICGFSYSIVRIPKFSVIKALFIWLTSDDTQRDRREVMIDVIGISLFAPVATAGTYIGFIFADSLESLPPSEEAQVNINELLMIASGRMALLTIISLMITFDVAYATWIAVRIQNHMNNWYAWYRRNSMVTLIIPSSRCQDS